MKIKNKKIRLTAIFILIAFFLISAATPGMAGTRGTIATSGDVGAVIIPLTAGIVALAHTNKNVMQLYKSKGLQELFESWGTAVAATLILKYTVKEERPNGENTQSFPSLHASSSFAAAGYLQRRYGWLYGLPAYAASTYVCWTRIDAREHYFHDVLIGAIIGFGASQIFTTPYKGIHIEPVAGKNQYGLIFTKKF